jgi:hypothetical protein
MFSLVNVRSASEDLTARARLRDAAVGRFGRDGFGASIRTIAADADVSPGLVMHHFGSKDALRAECDAYVRETIRVVKTESMTSKRPGDTIAQLATVSEHAPLLAYIVRSLAAGGTVFFMLVTGLAVGFTNGLISGSPSAGRSVPHSCGCLLRSCSARCSGCPTGSCRSRRSRTFRRRDLVA